MNAVQHAIRKPRHGATMFNFSLAASRPIVDFRLLRCMALAAMCSALAAAPGAVHAAESIDWYTVDCGGAMFSAGGNLELSGTIGQHDVGVLTGVQTGGTVLINQPPDQSNGFYSDADCNGCSGGAQSLAENFILTAQQSITTITMYGGYHPANNPGSGDDFTVIFHASDGTGVPGAALATQTGVASMRATTGVVIFGVNEYLHTLTLSPAVTLPAGTYAVEIYNNTVGNADSYFWEVGNLDGVSGIAGQAYAFSTPGVSWSYNQFIELAYSLTTSPGGALELRGGFWVMDVAPPPVACGCGDLDDNDIVNLGDFSLFAGCFGLPAPTPDCPADVFLCADLDGSGAIDLVDFSLFSGAFGLPAQGNPPDCD